MVTGTNEISVKLQLYVKNDVNDNKTHLHLP